MGNKRYDSGMFFLYVVRESILALLSQTSGAPVLHYPQRIKLERNRKGSKVNEWHI